MIGVRPIRLSGPSVVVAVVGAALFGVARTTGSGWLLVLLSVLAAVLVAGAVAPAMALRSVVLDVTGPSDATATRPMPIEVTVRRAWLGGLLLRPVSPAGGEVFADGVGAGTVQATPGRRGVLRVARFELRSGAPFGLVTWRRRVDVALPVPVHVAPLPIDVPRPPFSHAGGNGIDATGARAGEDAAVRSARAYEVGDPLRLVHWPATARTGELMVKQLEAPASPALAIVVDLRGDAERAASWAAGLGRDALADGLHVTLLTVEPEGPVAAPVRSVRELGRRLARAVGGAPPPEGPVPDGAHVVRVTG